MIAVSGTALVYFIVKTKKSNGLEDKTVPVMGVMSAFIFAAQTSFLLSQLKKGTQQVRTRSN